MKDPRELIAHLRSHGKERGHSWLLTAANQLADALEAEVKRRELAEAVCSYLETSISDTDMIEVRCDIGHYDDCDHCVLLAMLREWRSAKEGT